MKKKFKITELANQVNEVLTKNRGALSVDETQAIEKAVVALRKLGESSSEANLEGLASDAALVLLSYLVRKEVLPQLLECLKDLFS